MRYIIFGISLLLSLLLFTSRVSVQAQSLLYSPLTPTPILEYTLPYPGILPDHPLYIIKAARDRILLFFTSNPERRVHLNLLFADKRLVMGQLLWEKGSKDLAVTTISKAEKYLLAASLELISLKKQNNLPPGLADKLELAAQKHEEIILQMEKNLQDEPVRQGLSQALGVNHQALGQIRLVK